jgi:hypothetical protein
MLIDWDRPSLLLGMLASRSPCWRQEVLPCVQNCHQSRKTWAEDTEDGGFCVGDEADDCEEEGEASSKDSIMSLEHWVNIFR